MSGLSRGARSIILMAGGLGVAGCGQTQPPAAQPIVAAPAPSKRVPTIAAQPTPPPKPVVVATSKPAEPAVRLSPKSVTIEPGDPGVQFLVEGKGSYGGHGDLTAAARWAVDPPGIVQVSDSGYVRPLRPGKAMITASHGTESARAEAVVSSAAERPWDFAADIVPILTRFGCNTGGCHGKADGQNGFHLSLFGYDPEGDYRALTHDATGRRISLMSPNESLLLLKASGRVPHGGGQRLTISSDDYRTLRAWIEAGIPQVRGKGHGALVKVAVEPADTRLDEPGPQQLRVVATYTDGHTRDVTRLATFRVNDEQAATVQPNGLARLLRRAEADLIIRFQSNVFSTRLATLINPDSKYDFAKLPRGNLVDKELFKRLESLRVPPSPQASDAAFLRRVSLDLIGQVPETTEIREFLADKDPDKRAKKVDELIGRREFVWFWRIKLGDLLQISQARFGNGAGPYQAWLDKRLNENAPWDKMVRELLTALGNPNVREGGPVNYALDGMDAKVQAEQTAQRFMGLRIRCAQCHDHPFDVWTQDDYFGLAALFAKVQRPLMAPGMTGRPVVKVDPKGTVEHLRTKKPAQPRLLNHQVVELPANEDPRKALADWMTRPDNPFFARAAANWVWAQFFGKGLADPPDDLSRSNPPVHPELLDALARHFVDHHYDLRDLIRTVVTSYAYGMSSGTVPGNERDTRLFSHQMPRPLTAHQMADALATVTGVENRFGQLGKRKAIEINDPSTPSALLDTFGRCSRTNGCSAVATPSLSLRQSLLLIGGDAVDGKVSSLNGYLADLMGQSPPPEPDEIVTNLYFRTLCRPPTPEELSHWSAELKGAAAQHEVAEDLFWALLNSREFAFNH